MYNPTKSMEEAFHPNFTFREPYMTLFLYLYILLGYPGDPILKRFQVSL